MTDRSEQLRANLAKVREQVQRACDACGRENDVVIVAVTKTYPASDVRILFDLGIESMGENKDQEARLKAQACADLEISWHFIGQLQRNKAKSVAQYAQVIESVDRPELVLALARTEVPLDVLVQVSLDPMEAGVVEVEHSLNRGGVRAEGVDAVVQAIDAAPSLTLRGVMGVAPLGEDPAAAFARLARVRASLLAGHASATWMSAGMSHDLQEAVAAGATHVRVGSAILGERT